MKIVKLEDFHADAGWDTYSFLKITTDEGLTGWSEFNESRRKGHDRPNPRPRRHADRRGSMRARAHRRGTLRPLEIDRGWAQLPCHRRHRECVPRHQG